MKKASLIWLFSVSVLLLCLVYPVNAIGVFRNATGYWYLDYNKTGIADRTFQFGKAGDIPVTGDWNADGSSDAGVFRPSNGNWYLDTTKTGVVDTTFHLGASGDIPVIGDWNGDGTSDTGVFRPSNGNWYLDTTKTGVVDKSFHFGASGDIPVIGDWNGDGTSDTGVFRPSNGNWYLNYNASGEVDKTFHFGTIGDIPVIGDWNGDGTSDTGVFRPSNGNWYLNYNASGEVDKTFHFGTIGDIPVTGDWNADRSSDAGVFRPSNGNWYLDTTKTGVVDMTFHFGKAGDSPQVMPLPDTMGDAPVAAFISDIQSGIVPLTVKFTDQSTGTMPLTYSWDFNNDGTEDGSEQSPSYTYTAPGTYSIKLTVTNAAGSDMELKTGYITANPLVAPTAAFTCNKQSGTAPLTVAFTDLSTGTSPLTYAWDFTNDGIVESTSRNPSYTYQTAGTYSVRLTVTNAAGSDAETKTGYITVNAIPIPPTAAFTSNKQSGTAPLTVAFTDQSTGTSPLTYAWDFTNDGIVESTSRNPSYTYQTAGTYSVRLSVTNAYGNDLEMKSGYITVNPPIPPTAAFTSNKRTGTAPLTVRYTDQSTGTSPLTYAWDFTDDGINESTSQNPSYTYQTAGIYSVKLSVTNAAGSDVERKTTYITVNPPPVAPTAAFISDIQSGTAPLSVTFTDQSTGTLPLTYTWDFTNDGSADSSEQSPSYIYTIPGTYAVKLTVTNSAGSDVELKSGYITVTEVPVAPTAAFVADRQSGNTPLTVRFTDQSTGTSPLSYSWDFNNDGTPDSIIKSPSFVYDMAGTYTVNLTVTNTFGSDSELKTGYIIVNPTIAPTAAFVSDVQSGDAPLKVKFTDQSTGTPPFTYAWDFNDDGMTDSTSQSPSFTYTTAGTFSVTLTVGNSAGSDVRTEPDYIIVTEAPPSAHSGVAITFDDNYVDEWYAIRDILNNYNAHVTFFVSQFAGLDQSQINKLKTLQADGHEIAYHGYNHVDAVDYLQSHSINQYLENEIINGVNLMKDQGFDPVDFAYPNGSDDPAATQALQEYFGHIRDTYYSWDNTIYYQYGSNQALIAGIGMDESYGHSITEIYNGISQAKSDDTILIFYGHEPVPSNPGSYQTSYDRLDKILKYVSDNNLKTFTISEIQ